jgi:hypothetical protein
VSEILCRYEQVPFPAGEFDGDGIHTGKKPKHDLRGNIYEVLDEVMTRTTIDLPGPVRRDGE